ncbi:hypothetical protein D2962_06165 [Biomaibacter acetigenes]|uniref:Phage tail protein n=1 Tax=Biomaibacter acetigenes TaxID=2316383 RepID=A0A3G2R480_9FIRM|nr:hypothetical protein [Biomaibacter acetigenes]AYO30256.1 hypothetical protein D2962_06165 [Biomaibacter acetigenes]
MASQKELRALITLAGKVDPSLQTALMTASAQTSKASRTFSKLGSFASKGLSIIGKAAAVTGAAVAAGIGTGTVALGGLLMKATETGDQLVKMRDKTGLSAEELQRLQYISSQLGTNFEALPQAISIMTKQMDAARKGSKDTAAAFQALGISVTDGAGKLRPQSQVFQEALVQLSKIENQADRNALAFKLFGRGAAELFPILNAGTDEIQKLAAEADKLGLVMSGEQVEALDNLGDTIDKLKLSVMGLGNRILASLLPKIQPIIDKLVSDLPAIAPKLSSALGGFLGNIANLLPDLLNVASQFAQILMPIFDTIGSTMGPMLVNIIQQALPIVMQIIQTAMPLLNQGLSMLISLIQPLLPLLMQLVQQILPIAAQMIMVVFSVLQPIIPVLVQLIQDILPPIMQILQAILPFLQALTPIIAMVATIISSLLTTALSAIIPVLTEIVQALLPPLMQILNSIFPILQAVIPIIQLLANVIGTVLGGAIKLVMPIIEKFLSLISPIANLASKFIGGVSNVIGSVGKFLGLNGKNVELQANVSSSMPRFAEGGIATEPSIFGEADWAEMAIPLKRTPRSLSLLNKTAQILGAKPAGSSIQIIYNPTIYGGNRAELEPILQKHKEELRMMIEEIERERARVAYGYS